MFLTVKDLILHYPAPTSVMVRKILVEDHGFSGTDFDHYFYQDERGDTATNILYFEYMVYMQEHELPSAGTFFRKPRNVEGFNGLNIMEKLDPEISKLMKDPDFTEKFDQSFSELESFRFMKSRLLEDQS